MNKVRIGVDTMSKFVYVFDESARDALLAEDYTLLKHDKKNNIYVFENKSGQHVNFSNIVYTLSDTLTF